MLGYIVSAGCYLSLLLGILTVWRQPLRGAALVPAFAVQIAWCVLLALYADGAQVPLTLLAAIECVRTCAWAWVLARWLTAAAVIQSRRRLIAAAIAVGFASCLDIAFSPPVPGYASRFWLWAGLTVSIGGLVVVEQVARNTRTDRQWRFKYVWLGIGVLFTWDLLFYSSALLQGQAGRLGATLWQARGFLNAIVAVLLLAGLRRIRTWQAAEFLSPRPLFFNATLLGSTIYILAIAGASYLIREHGGTWAAVGQAVFLAGATLVLIVTLMSEQFRAWTRVMVAKYVSPYRYDYRDEWRKLTRALSQSDQTSVYDRISVVMARSVNCGAGGLWLRDEAGAFLPAGGELAPPHAPSERGAGAFFEYLRRREWIYDLEAARAADPRDRTPRAPAWMLGNANLWLVVPLVCNETLVGFVILSSALAQPRLTWEEIDLLRAAGRQVASFLAFEQAARRLAEARQFEAVNHLSAFLMHDLRHLVAQLALVVQNASKHRGNPAFFDDAIQTIDDSVQRMTRLMHELRTGMAVDHKQRIDIRELCQEVVLRCSNRQPVPTLTLPERNMTVLANRDSLSGAIEHIIGNAQDATPASGSVAIELQRCGQRAVIHVKDTGTGMDGDFVRHRLFRPFDTTKAERGLGLGAYEVRERVLRNGGQVEVESLPGVGTKFTISLPLAVVSSTKSLTITNELQAS